MSAGIFALFFFGEVPRVRRDILQKFPFFDQYYDRRLPPEDNVSATVSICLELRMGRLTGDATNSPSNLFYRVVASLSMHAVMFSRQVVRNVWQLVLYYCVE